jgi:hypothetical protein
MARQRQRDFIFRNTGAIVAYPDQLFTAGDKVDADRSRSGIQAVFQQFLDYRCRPLNGRSTTSPAAIWLTRWPGSSWIGMGGRLPETTPDQRFDEVS